MYSIIISYNATNDVHICSNIINYFHILTGSQKYIRGAADRADFLLRNHFWVNGYLQIRLGMCVLLLFEYKVHT